jgi:molybdopterin-containing oxidoreductase family iron-sulfur binding subunit
MLRDFWRQRAEQEKRGDFEAFWHESIRAGIVTNTAAAAKDLGPRPDIATQLPPLPAGKQGALQVLFRPDEGTWDGRYADNPWLLELERAFTRLTWDNAAVLAPATAKRLGVQTDDVVEIEAAQTKVRAPVYVLPGQASDCIMLPLGWGRTSGGLGAGIGFDAYRLRHSASPWATDISSIAKTGEVHRLAITQRNDRTAGRDVIREAALEQFNSNPETIVTRSHTGSLYPPYEYPDRAWAMAIDLNSCIGCQACTIA